MRTLFAQDADPNLRFTTLLDVYALPDKVPGYVKSSAAQRNASEVASIETAWVAHFNVSGKRRASGEGLLRRIVWGDGWDLISV